MFRDRRKLIRAYPLEEFFENKVNSWRGTFSGTAYVTALEKVKEAPAVDAVEVVHGRWIFKHNPITDPKKYFIRIVCSECNLHTGQKSNYCPNCGAKMDGERKDND